MMEVPMLNNAPPHHRRRERARPLHVRMSTSRRSTRQGSLNWQRACSTRTRRLQWCCHKSTTHTGSHGTTALREQRKVAGKPRVPRPSPRPRERVPLASRSLSGRTWKRGWLGRRQIGHQSTHTDRYVCAVRAWGGHTRHVRIFLAQRGSIGQKHETHDHSGHESPSLWMSLASGR